MRETCLVVASVVRYFADTLKLSMFKKYISNEMEA